MANLSQETGLFQLSTHTQSPVLENYFQNQAHYQMSLILGDNESNISPIRYLINSAHKIIIFSTPISNTDLQSYLKLVKNRLREEEIDNYHLIIPLIGQGMTERHIVTFYKSPGKDTKPILFDSKHSNPNHFFDTKKTSRFADLMRIIVGAIKAFYRGHYKEEIKLADTLSEYIGFEKIDYSSLGTQSYFDRFTCGYHTLANVLASVSLITKAKPVSAENLLNELKNNNNNSLNSVIELLKKSKVDIKTGYLMFVKQAWRDTFLSGLDAQQRQTIHFSHYFLGWPHGEIGGKIIYMALLGFLVYPLKNSLKLLIEFPIQLLVNSIDYIKNNLLLWIPTAKPLQYLRSSLLLINYGFYGMLTGVAFFVHALTAIIPNTFTFSVIKEPNPTIHTPTVSADDDFTQLIEDSLVSHSSFPSQKEMTPPIDIPIQANSASKIRITHFPRNSLNSTNTPLLRSKQTFFKLPNQSNGNSFYSSHSLSYPSSLSI